MSLLDKASLIVTPNGYKASKLYSVVPSDGSGDMTVTRATTATRVNSLGLIESVANNVPRLDYLNESCPSLLVEPQRTNLVPYSEQFDNVAWLKSTQSGTLNVTANYEISPDGTQNADRIQMTISGFNSYSDVVQIFSTTAGISYTYSVYLKSLSGTPTIAILYDSATATNKLVTLTNDWKRYTFTINPSGIFIYPRILLENGITSNSADILAWGSQLEVGSYATSYIPTTTASVTRNADVISKTGISSLIGQTEGTLFVEEVYDASIANNGGLDDTLVSLTDGTSSNLISIFHYGLGIGNVLFFIRLSGATQVAISTSTPTSGTYKIALAYKNNDVVGYINGIQIGTDTSATIPATSVITLVDPITTNAATKTVKRKNVSVWKTRLTNAELATLTTL